MTNSESLHEYFSDDKNEEIDHYVKLNSLVVSDFITKKVRLFFINLFFLNSSKFSILIFF